MAMVEAKKNVFGDVAANASEKSLVLTGKKRVALTKAQEAFNRLVTKIEHLHAKLRDDTARLEAALMYFEKHLQTRNERVLSLRKEIVLTLAAYLEPGLGKLKKWEREMLGDFLADQLAEISKKSGGLPKEFVPLFETLHGVSFEEVKRDELESVRAEMKDMFDSFGIDIDLSGMRADMSQEEMAQEAARIAARLRAEQERLEHEEPEPEKPRSRKQAKKLEEARKVDEARKTSLSKIYRDLARVLHPDLEPDEAVRPLKVELMAKLTAAYRDNDMHTLLKLELEWMEREDGDVSRLTDEKLKIYNQVLKEQAFDLEGELYGLREQARYQDVVGQGPHGRMAIIDVASERRALDEMIEAMEEGLEGLRGSDALRVVRKIVRDSSGSRDGL
jgi:hypothetical protein